MKLGYIYDIVLTAALIASLIWWTPQALAIFVLCWVLSAYLGGHMGSIIYKDFNGQTKICKGREVEFWVIGLVKVGVIALSGFGITLLFH